MTYENDIAYPSPEYGNGFTKREIVLKDFMCAIVSTLEEDTNIDEKLSDAIVKEASNLTKAYFKELNKQSQ